MSLDEATKVVDPDPYSNMRHQIGKATDLAQQRLKQALKQLEIAQKNAAQCEHELTSLRKANEVLNPEQSAFAEPEQGYERGW